MPVLNPSFDHLALGHAFDNANPRPPGLVEAEADGTYVVQQHLEDEAPKGYSFHLHVALLNRAPKAQTIPLRIRWAEDEFDFCHDYLYIGYDSGARWLMLSTPCQDGVTEMKLVVPHGRHLLCCSPKFDYGDYLSLLDRYAAEPGFERLDVATTPEGRSISCLRCGNPEGRTFVITTRAHGYETAGAYCIAGWLEEVAAGTERAVEPLEKLDLYLFPMLDPDAVAHGHCCLAPSGIDFGRELATAGSRDCGAQGFVDFVSQLQPDFYLDMHNNTGPHLSDAFRSTDPRILERFESVAPDRSRDQKVWTTRQVTFPDDYLLNVCEQRFGTLPMLTEFPWYARLPGDMRDHGREFLTALLELATEA